MHHHHLRIRSISNCISVPSKIHRVRSGLKLLLIMRTTSCVLVCTHGCISQHVGRTRRIQLVVSPRDHLAHETKNMPTPEIRSTALLMAHKASITHITVKLLTIKGYGAACTIDCATLRVKGEPRATRIEPVCLHARPLRLFACNPKNMTKNGWTNQGSQKHYITPNIYRYS